MPSFLLLPQPQSISDSSGEVTLADGKLIAIAHPAYLFSAQRLQRALEKIGLRWEIVANSSEVPGEAVGVCLETAVIQVSSDNSSYPHRTTTPTPVRPSVHQTKNAYEVEIGSDCITVRAAEGQAIWWGVCTLIQILEQAGKTLPLMCVTDWPDYSRRGVMLDISRDKVPTMDTLYGLIDRLATWKINEVQLYTEHTFAYRGHPEVWQKASPMTGQEILELDSFCRERYIDLVPNQNSFGHMHRWLIHERYHSLAEVPEGLDWPIFLTPRPFSIAPGEPGSLELIKSLYDELLPHFSSTYFNVGLDETLDLGRGRSKEAVEQRGKTRVYLDFVKQVEAMVRERGRTMQFWGDIIIQHPELVPEVPESAIAMEWGYDATHPFDEHGKAFEQANIRYYVCPGTSSWISLVGRTENAVGNLRNAAINGRKHGAIGYLNTDWGDYGHWQPLPSSYLGFAYGAGLSWAIDANVEMDIPAILSRYAFEDPTGKMGQIAYDVGNVYQMVTGYSPKDSNGALMVRALLTTLEGIRTKPLAGKELKQIDPKEVRAAIKEMERLEKQLDKAKPADPEVIKDYKWAISLWKHGCKRLIMAQDKKVYSKKSMAAEIRKIMKKHRKRWLARNRPGGLDDSLVRLERLLQEYES